MIVFSFNIWIFCTCVYKCTIFILMDTLYDLWFTWEYTKMERWIYYIGLCKSKWERFGKNTAGKYEYVDVNRGDKNRFIVETNLASEFEIAKPTTRYLSLLAQLPRVFVGTPEELKKLVRIMCFEIRRSMKRAEIHVPPWRRNAYMQAKWFGHYKRTSNEVVTRVKSCGCGPRVGFEGLVKTATFNGYKEVERKRQGLKVGQLTVAFTGSGVRLS